MIGEKFKFYFRFFFVDWGFKFPVRCAFRRTEIDEVPDFENFTIAEKRDVMSFGLRFSDQNIARVVARLDDPDRLT